MHRFLTALLAAVLLFPSCRRETPQADLRPVVRADHGPRDGGQIVRRLESDLQTLDYIQHTTEDERQVLALIYEPLIEFDQNLQPVPGVATRWRVEDEGRTYVLDLDPRARFSDGQPVRAADVVFTLQTILDDESPQFATWFEGLDREKTKAMGDHTVRAVFAEPRAGRLYSFNIGVLPEHSFGKQKEAPLGSGPYVLRRRERGRSILLERRDDYWREKPHIASILFRPIADDAVAWKAVQHGDVDVARVNNDVWFRVKDDRAVKRKVEFYDAWLNSYNAIVWNLDDPLFADARIRRALAMTFDRQGVIDRLYHGQARPVSGPFAPDQWANNGAVVPVEFNLQGAAALLASAGWNDSDSDGVLDREGKAFAFDLLIPAGNAASTGQSQVLQESLRTIGVKLEIRPLDEAAFFETVLKRNFQAAFLAVVNEPDPDPSTFFHSGQIPPEGFNLAGYRNAEADQLMETARREFDQSRRADLYHQLHEILARDQPWLWTVQVASKWAVNRRVRNVRTAPGFGLFLWKPGPMEWWLAGKVERKAIPH